MLICNTVDLDIMLSDVGKMTKLILIFCAEFNIEVNGIDELTFQHISLFCWLIYCFKTNIWDVAVAYYF